MLSDMALFILPRNGGGTSESGSHPGRLWHQAWCVSQGRREPRTVLKQDRGRGWTHPAAPAAPSPRSRETSFSLPRRMDSRSLEKELLRRRVWGGRRGRWSASPDTRAPFPREPAQSPHLLLCVTGDACVGGSWRQMGTLSGGR